MVISKNDSNGPDLKEILVPNSLNFNNYVNFTFSLRISDDASGI